MLEVLSRNPNEKQLREFGKGLTLLSTTALVLGFLFFDLPTPWLLVLMILVAFGALGAFLSIALVKPVYLAFFCFSLLAGHIFGPLLLTAVYFVIITPTGLVSRLFGKKWLEENSRDFDWQPLSESDQQAFDRLF